MTAFGTTSLTQDENQVLALKYKSKRFGAMEAAELTRWCKALLSKIHIITGWTIPEDELLSILLDQFQKKVLEDYPDLNPDEMEYAFRSKGTVVKDWGKKMNLALLDEVLIPYKAQRFELSQYEERKAKLIENPLPKWAIECEYCYVRQQEINKLPVLFKK